MKKRLLVLIFMCIFLFNLTQVQTVSAQINFQTFENNPIEYWDYQFSTLTYHSNDTISFKNNQTYTESWLEDYDYRKEINIEHGVSCGTNYQVLIIVNYNAHMQTDFDDIRFTDNDKVTLLDAYRETYVASSYARYWVEVSDNLNSDQTIYMYYGNALATLRSSGYNTFVMFDNFNDGAINLTIWTNTVGTIPTESLGYLVLTGVSGGGNLYSDLYANVSRGFEYNISAYASHTYTYSGRHFSMIDHDRGSSDYVNGYDTVTANTWTIGTINDGASSNTNVAFSAQTSERRYSIYGTSSAFKWFEVNTLKHTSSTNIPTENLDIWFTRATTNTRSWYINNVTIRNKGTTEPTYVIQDEKSLTVDFPYFENAHIQVPILDSETVAIKTMVEANTYYDNETVLFQIITDEGIEENLFYELNTTDITRIDISIKKSINIYRITISDEFQAVINRIQYSHIISKQIVSLNITLCNFTTNSKLTMYFLSGSLDYSEFSDWKYEELSVAPYDRGHADTEEPFAHQTSYDEESVGIGIHYSYSREFFDFQYIRSYINIQYSYNYLSSESSYNTYLKLNISNYYFLINIDDIHAGESAGTFSYISVYEDNIQVFVIDSFDGEPYNEGDTFEMSNNYKIWRTLDDRLGLGLASDTQLFRFENDTRITLEEFTYYYTDIINDFSGNISIEHNDVIATDATDYDYNKVTFDEMEYDFNADFGIAEPHFSSTWFDLFGFGWLGQGINYVSGLINSFYGSLGLPNVDLPDLTIDFFAGIAESISAVLSPIIESVATTLSPIIESIATILSPIIEDIGIAFDDFVSSLAVSILDWADSVITWFIDTVLMSIVDAVADFLIWFINGIGSLLGIVDLAGIIADMLINFALSITNFLNGIVLFFVFVGDLFTFAITTITIYAPLVIYYGGIIFLIITFLTIATMDADKITALFGLYAKVFSKILEIFYNLANMVIQFLGGIIP